MQTVSDTSGKLGGSRQSSFERMISLFALLTFCLSVANAQGGECHGEQCAQVSQQDNSVFITVMPNGGNNTGVPIVETRISTTLAQFDAKLLDSWATELGLKNDESDSKLASGLAVTELSVRNRFGGVVKSPKELRDNDVIFLVPSNERWIWPGFYIGIGASLCSFSFSLSRVYTHANTRKCVRSLSFHLSIVFNTGNLTTLRLQSHADRRAGRWQDARNGDDLVGATNVSHSRFHHSKRSRCSNCVLSSALFALDVLFVVRFVH
jgi:hypothetical protein